MTRWRPRPEIRVIAIGLHWRDGKLLAAEVLNDAGRIKGVRPLGGGVEFGETWCDALTREFQEELGIAVTVSDTPMVMENIYTHEGTTGHEVAFIADVSFPESAYRDTDRITFQEDNGVQCVARWFDPADLDVGGPELYPKGLKALLLRRNNPTDSVSRT